MPRPPRFTLNASHPFADQLVFAGLSPQGLVGSSHYHDSSARANHGTIVGSTAIAGSQFVPELGRIAYGGFDYLNYINLPGLSNVPSGTQFSLSFWAYRATNMVTPAAIAWDGEDDFLYYVCESEGSYYTRIFWRNVNGAMFASTTGDLSGRWHHYLSTFASGKQSLYVDGKYVGGATSSTSSKGPFSGCRLGNWGDNTSQNFSGGSLSDVMLWDCDASAFASSLGDPSNVMLSGLIVPPRRKLFAVPATGGATTHQGSATVSGSMSLIAGGIVTKEAAVTVAASCQVSAGGIVTKDASATVVASCQVSAGGIVTKEAAATVTGQMVLAANGDVQAAGIFQGSATVAGSGQVTATGTVTAAASAAIAGQMSVAASGDVQTAGVVQASATVAAQCAITAAGIRTVNATANVAGACQVSAIATGIKQAAASVPASQLTTAKANAILEGSATISGQMYLSTMVGSIIQASAEISGTMRLRVLHVLAQPYGMSHVVPKRYESMVRPKHHFGAVVPPSTT